MQRTQRVDRAKSKDAKSRDAKDGAKDEGRTYLKPNAASYKVIGCAMRVHTAIGPGALERAVAACMKHEMTSAGLFVEQELIIPVVYDGETIPLAYRADFVVEKCLVVEIKCVAVVLPIHRAQLRNYLTHSGLKLGLLLNFNVHRMKEGIHRIVNGLDDDF